MRNETSRIWIWLLYVNVGLRGTHREKIGMHTHGAPAGGGNTHRAVPTHGVHNDCKSSHVLRNETSLIWLLYVNVGLRGKSWHAHARRPRRGGPMHIAPCP